MAAICSRIFLFYNLFYTIFLSLLPKKLRHYLPSSYNPHQQQIHEVVVTTTTTAAATSPLPLPPSTPRSSRMDSDQLQRIFQMFDKNGDSRITKEELNDSLENMGIFIPDADLTQMIDNIDENHDGCVDIDEFGALYKSIMDDRENEEDVKEAFNVFDQNRDGFITVEELRSVLESLGLKEGRKADDCRRMIMKVDVDGDGMVSFMEFKEMMRSGGFSAMAQNWKMKSHTPMIRIKSLIPIMFICLLISFLWFVDEFFYHDLHIGGFMFLILKSRYNPWNELM